ncbi:HutD family protein [Paraburkholderia sp. Ac-20347]|uniref:HutD/Ves family protein n=1 Tax=Paraburkholderia sp. Ac-20347 TaxID=2703892 RepID=UPI001F122CEE|nr:HutD family protein [Paraburkholderia sp. Ac-20347]
MPSSSAGANTGTNASAPRTVASSAVRFVDCTRLAPEPWANGDGTTLTVARGDGQQADQRAAAPWRVSIATLDGPAKFSQFPGYDRTLLPIDDAAFDLHSQDGQLPVHSGQPVHFSGDLHVWVNPHAQPLKVLRVLNVMTKRGTCRAHVSVVSHSLRVTPAATHLLLSLAGQWHVESALLHGVTLAPLNALWLGGRPEELALRTSDPGAQLVSIAIETLASNTEGFRP